MTAFELRTRKNIAYDNVNIDSYMGTYVSGAAEVSVATLEQIEMLENLGNDPQQILSILKDTLKFKSDYYINIMEENKNG